MSELTVGEKLGKYIKYQRKKRKMTIAELGKKSGLTPAYISRLEQGDYDSPTIDAVTKLSNGLQMPLTALLSKSGSIENAHIELPDLAYYLHEKYSFPPEAIEDVELFFEMVQKKYAEEIAEFKKESDEYWNGD